MAAWHALKNGAARPTGSFYEWMTANVFAAFCLEAYLNHLGARRFKCWENLERLSVEAKLSLLLEDLGQKPDFTCRPFQTVKEVFRFRNQIAHGRTESLEETSSQKLFDGGDGIRYPQARWERQCVKAVADRFLADSKAVIEHMHRWAGLSTIMLWSPGQGGASARLPDPFPTVERAKRKSRTKKGVPRASRRARTDPRG
jgi:hypothetical protein